MTLFLTLILVLSTLLRSAFITTTPPELFGDEVDVGYQAYSLFKTGKDLYGQVLPTYIHSLSEWRAPLLMYATVPTIATTGLNEYGVRLPEIIFGSLAPIILFLLVYKTSRSYTLSLFSSLSLAIMPWHVHYSRVAFEVVIMLDLIMLGTLLFLKRRYALCFIFFALSMYAYSTAIVFVPLWITILILLTKKRPSFVSLSLLLFILAPLAYNIVAGPARQRFGLVSLANNKDIIDSIVFLRHETNSPLEPLFHNKPESYLTRFLYNYLHSFSTDFLFIRGDPVARHNSQIIGQLLPLSIIFFPFGAYYLISRRHWLWLVWWFVAPIPSSLTTDGGYHATRLFFMVAPAAVIIGAGIYQLWQILPQRIRIFSYSLLLLLITANYVWFAHFYLIHYSKSSWRWWHVGYKSSLQELSQQSDGYSRVFINNTYEPSLIRFLFWTKYPPAKFHRQFTIDQPQKDIVPNYDGFSLDGKYFFGSFSKGISLLPNSLYLISQRDDVGGDWDWRKSPPENIKVLSTSTNLYDQPIFYLITKK